MHVSSLVELHSDDLVFGYVKDVNDKGCFLWLTRTIIAHVLIKDLSDGFVKNLKVMHGLGLGLVWVWFGLVWFGLVWFGLVWFGLLLLFLFLFLVLVSCFSPYFSFNFLRLFLFLFIYFIHLQCIPRLIQGSFSYRYDGLSTCSLGRF